MQNEKQGHPLQEYYSKIYKRYDLVNRIFTFGRDRYWRSLAVDACIKNNPDSILDICTGTGDLILAIGRRRPATTYLAGYDFSSEMLQRAREKAKNKINRPEFLEGNVASMPFKDNQFDTAGISFGLRNLIFENSEAKQHLFEIRRVIKPGGYFVILESSKPLNPIWRLFNNLYLQYILPWLGGLFSGNLKAYRYLARSSKNYYTRKQMAGILEDSGFRVTSSKALFLGSVMLLVAEKQ